MDENILDQNVGAGELSITPEIRTYLAETAKWAKLLAIVGFVMIGFFVILGLFMGSIIGAFAGASPEMEELGMAGSMMGGMFGAIYIVIALFYFFPTLYLYRFASKMKTALANQDQQFLAESFRNHKSVYKFMGIFTLVMLGFYALMIVVSLVAGIGMSM